MAENRASSIIGEVQKRLENRIDHYPYQHIKLDRVEYETVGATAVKVAAFVMLDGEQKDITLFNRADVFDDVTDESETEVVKELVKAFDSNEFFTPYKECTLAVDGATEALINILLENVKVAPDLRRCTLLNVYKKQLKFNLNGENVFLDVCNETEMRVKAALKKTKSWPVVSLSTILECMNRREAIQLLCATI